MRRHARKILGAAAVAASAAEAGCAEVLGGGRRSANRNRTADERPADERPPNGGTPRDGAADRGSPTPEPASTADSPPVADEEPDRESDRRGSDRGGWGSDANARTGSSAPAPDGSPRNPIDPSAPGAGTPPASEPGSGTPGQTPADVPPDGSELRATVREVVDGDTLRVELDDGSEAIVSLAGVDAPELSAAQSPAAFEGVPDTAGGRQYLYAWAWMADAAVRSALAGERVGLRLIRSRDADADGGVPEISSPAYVFAGGTNASANVNLELLRSGLARATDDDHPEAEAFARAEREAREAAVGLWDLSEPLRVP
ncbi:thermonuclease family protein [Halegenticoccus soli]|uniref:thermonuclease family protein n=1 Tax=Halegenticoccus soli TaxID=1985678 RepID=UPI000C6D1244|nr:thermonuclease family protein [Halegenticoccus soli]